jgi:hypothetical protein
MTPDERNMLLDLASKVAQTPAPQRDPEAENIVRTKIGSRPDALYLMTQTVLIQNMALQRAQQQIQELQQKAGQGQVTASGSSWLGQSAPAQQQQYAPPPPQYSSPAPSSFGGGGGGSSFLRGAAQTAAGVAAGTLAAEAIGSMFSHHGGGLFGGNEFIGGGGVAPTEEVINNSYDSPGGSDAGLAPTDDRADNFVDPGDVNQADDIQADDSQYDDGSQFDDAGLDTGDGGGFDTGSDDSYV